MAKEVADEAVQIFGGYGLMKEYEIERMYRDVRILQIGEGTSEIQRLVISRYILKDENKWEKKSQPSSFGYSKRDEKVIPEKYFNVFRLKKYSYF